MSLASVIRKAAQGNPTGEPKGIAKGLIQRLTKSELTDLLADEIATEQRFITLAAEKSAFAKEFLAKPASVGTEGVRAAFKELAGTKFALGTGLEVQWLEATVEDHLQRISYLSKLRDGIDSTIARHQAAVEAITKAGVTCLGDIAAAGDELPAEIVAA